MDDEAPPPDPALPMNAEAIRRTFDQMFDLYVRPELDRRRAAGTLVEPFELVGFQVLLSGGKEEAGPAVRLNTEVRAMARMSLPATHDFRVGDDFHPGADTKIEAVHLLDEEEGKFAHFTALRIYSKWYYTFDFRYQKNTARDHCAAAEEFLAAAEHAHAGGHIRAFLENAHSCVELLVKVDLFLINQVFEGQMHHKVLRSKAAAFVHLEDRNALLERLADLRLPGRYLVGNLKVETDEINEIRAALNDFAATTRTRVQKHGSTFGDAAREGSLGDTEGARGCHNVMTRPVTQSDKGPCTS